MSERSLVRDRAHKILRVRHDEVVTGRLFEDELFELGFLLPLLLIVGSFHEAVIGRRGAPGAAVELGVELGS